MFILSQAQKLVDQFAGSEEQQIETSLGSINVRTSGAPGGVPLVFWPSLMMNHSMWSYQYQHFAPDYHVVLIDSPGIGKSEALRKLIDQRDCAKCLVEILDALAIDRCFLIGSTWGAMLATLCAAWIPQRLLGVVALNVTASAPGTYETVTMENLADVLYCYAETPEWWMEVVNATFVTPAAKRHDPEFVEFLRVVLKEDPKSLSFSIRGIDTGRKENHAVLKKVRGVPALIIAGEEDTVWPPEEAQKVADAIQGSQLVVVPGAGHLAARDRPDAVNESIEAFLGGLSQLRKSRIAYRVAPIE